MKSAILAKSPLAASLLLALVVGGALAVPRPLQSQSAIPARTAARVDSDAGANDGPTDRIAVAMKAMQVDSASLGEPSAESGRLFFGSSQINGQYAIVDGLLERFGCTATFYVKRGGDYVSISTNVQCNGDRAVGNLLDPHGPAFADIDRGAAHYGVVDILGRRYQAGYEPIKNSAGAVVGAYSVGVALDLGAGMAQ